MYLEEFPNITWLRENASQGFAAGRDFRGNALSSAGWPTVILNTQSDGTERDQIVGPFSMFYNLTGTSLVGLDRKWHKISNNFFCLSNNHQTYDLHIPKGERTTTFNIHFSSTLFEEVSNLIQQKNEWNLDNAYNLQNPDLTLLSRTEYMDDTLRSIIQDLYQYRRRNEEEYAPDKEYELIGFILEHLLTQAQVKLKRLDQISALKVQTRKELFKRVHLGLDYIHSSDLSSVDLETIARQSGLSKFHFLRVFKEVMGITPTDYISRLRIQKATNLLHNSRKHLIEIAIELGFSELSSFSRFYKRATGTMPSSSRG